MAQKAYDSVREDYKTPQWIIDKLLDIAQVKTFDMDTCCSECNIPAIFYAMNSLYDGLAIDWRGKCFLNPPFKQTRFWLRKAYAEFQKDRKSTEVYMVLPADRLETNYYQELIIKNPDCLFAFLPGKVGFVIPGYENETPKPSQKIMIAIFSMHALEIQYSWNWYNWFNTKSFVGNREVKHGK